MKGMRQASLVRPPGPVNLATITELEPRMRSADRLAGSEPSPWVQGQERRQPGRHHGRPIFFWMVVIITGGGLETMLSTSRPQFTITNRSSIEMPGPG